MQIGGLMPGLGDSVLARAAQLLELEVLIGELRRFVDRLRACGAVRVDDILGAERGAPTGGARPTATPALCAFESMVAVDRRLLSADGAREPLPTGFLKKAFGDVPHADVVNRGWVFFEQPVNEPKPLFDRKIGAFD